MGVGYLSWPQIGLFFFFVQVVPFGLGLFLTAILSLRVTAGAAAFTITAFTAFFTLLLAAVFAVVGGLATHVLKTKELIEAGVEGDFLVCGFRQHHGQGALQMLLVLIAHQLHGADGVKSFGGRNAHVGVAQCANEVADGAIHAHGET